MKEHNGINLAVFPQIQNKDSLEIVLFLMSILWASFALIRVVIRKVC